MISTPFLVISVYFFLFCFCIKDKTTHPQVNDNCQTFMDLRSWKSEDSAPKYDEVKSFLVFFQVYAVPIIEERNMKKWEISNPNNCHLNKLTAASNGCTVFL